MTLSVIAQTVSVVNGGDYLEKYALGWPPIGHKFAQIKRDATLPTGSMRCVTTLSTGTSGSSRHSGA